MNPAPDNDFDLAKFAADCEIWSAGMEQQAISSRSGTALQGHPNPEYAFGYVSSLLKQAVVVAKRLLDAQPKPDATVTETTSATKPKSK